MLSVIITALNEIYLEKTIRNVLENARGEIEIVVLLDGYLPNPEIEIQDSRVRFFHFSKSIGQRQAINYGAKQAKGKYIMKLDAHCAVDEGFDTKLIKDCNYDWTVVPRMYNLDVNTFKPKLHKLTDYMYISSFKAEKPFRAQYYSGQDYRKLHRSKEKIADTMCCMGPGWFLHKDRYWELGGLDEAHGGWGQMGIEVALKAWLSGGSFKVNKNTWFAHWFRGDVGFPYPASGKEHAKAREYSKDLWLNNKWGKAVRKLDWVVNKFSPPGWGMEGLEMARGKMDNVSQAYREIRKVFGVRTQRDFAPYGTKFGTSRDLLPIVFNSLGFKLGAEIGVMRGAYSKKLLEGVKDLHMHCIDPWKVYSESKFTVEQQESNYNKTLINLAPYGDRVTVHKMESLQAVDKFQDGSLDFVFIDGMHTFNACVQDLIKWCPKVKKGGIIGVHDYIPMRRGGVIEAVDGYTKCNGIAHWFVIREAIASAFWVNE